MTRRPRRNQTPAFKSKVALAAIKGEKTLDWLSSSMCMPTRSRNGSVSFWGAPPMCW
jgi:hypothetical protein